MALQTIRLGSFAGVKQGACFLYAVPSVGKVQPGLGVAGKQRQGVTI